MFHQACVTLGAGGSSVTSFSVVTRSRLAHLCAVCIHSEPPFAGEREKDGWRAEYALVCSVRLQGRDIIVWEENELLAIFHQRKNACTGSFAPNAT